MATYHIFMRGSDQQYHAACKRTLFFDDARAVEYAQALVSKFPRVEVWLGEILIAELQQALRPC
jgi:hypothetical protein